MIRPRAVALLFAPLLLGFLAKPALSLDRCKAKTLRDGTIAVSASDVVGTAQWSVRYGDETNALDPSGCVFGSTLRNCAVAPLGDAARTTKPAGCVVYLRDDGPTRCNAWVRRCLGTTEPPACPMLPADNIWNRDISTMPVHAMSDAWVATIGAGYSLHPDFGFGPHHGRTNGIPFVNIGATQPLIPITFRYFEDSDPGPYPMPPLLPIEGGGARPSKGRDDAHVLLVQEGTCLLYEVFSAQRPNAAQLRRDGDQWFAGSGAVYDLHSNALRPDTLTSADAAGLPILPGLVRYDEILAGEIRHAIRFTAITTQQAYVWPARHFASPLTDPAQPPMGIRVRLKASVDITGFSPTNRIILTALQKYGMMLADNGGPWFITGAPDDRWNDDDLHQLTHLHGNDFEVVDVSTLMIDPDSGQAVQ